MIVRSSPITLKWVLKKSPTGTVYAATHFDLQITAPDGSVVYYEDGAWITSYLAPTLTDEGLITFNTTFIIAGVYTLILGTGISSNFVIIDTSNMIVVEKDNDFVMKVKLD